MKVVDTDPLRRDVIIYKSWQNFFLRTFRWDEFVVFSTTEQSGSVQNLVQDDGEAVDVSFLGAGPHSDAA